MSEDDTGLLQSCVDDQRGPQGWDTKVNNAIMRAFGNGKEVEGRRRLAQLALDLKLAGRK